MYRLLVDIWLMPQPEYCSGVDMIDIPGIYIITVGLVGFSILSLWLNCRLWWSGKRYRREVDRKQRGDRVVRGLISEQFAPFTETFQELGWDPQEFKFLGRPVDGVQFQEDEIIIVEFKTGNADLSSKQRHIKDLVDRRQVRFQEVRL